MKLRYLLAAVGSLVALNFTSAPASAIPLYTMNIDENGSCSLGPFDNSSPPVPCKPAVHANGTCSDAGPCSVYTTDPTGKVTGNVWIFTFGENSLGQNILVATTDINIYDPGYPNIKITSDHLRTIDPNGSNSSCTQLSGLPACANRVIYYSVDDLGGQPFTSTTPAVITENANGTWEFVGNVIDFNGVSDVPVPATLPLFATGLGVLGLLGWRRKRKAQAI